MTRLKRYSAWIWIGLGIAVIAAADLLTAGTGEMYPPLSVQSAQPDGALALYLWLARSGYHVRRGTGPGLGGLRPGTGTLMVITPVAGLSPADTEAVLRWVAGGGRVVLVTDGSLGADLLRRLDMTVVPAPPAAIQVMQPLLLAPPTARVDGTAAAVELASTSDTVIAATADGPVLSSRRWGRGEIWICTAPALLDNAHIGRTDNRRLALNLVGPAGSAVAFDEYQPSSSSEAPSNWLFHTPWGIDILFAVTVLLLYRWLSGLRLGPPVVPLLAGQRPAAEYVVSMAGLLRRAHKRTEILHQYQRELRRILREHVAEDDDSGDRRRPQVERLLAPPGELSEKELLRRVDEIVECEEQLRRTRV